MIVGGQDDGDRELLRQSGPRPPWDRGRQTDPASPDEAAAGLTGAAPGRVEPPVAPARPAPTPTPTLEPERPGSYGPPANWRAPGNPPAPPSERPPGPPPGPPPSPTRPVAPTPPAVAAPVAAQVPPAADPARWELMGEELRAAGLVEEEKILSAMGWRKLLKLEESPDERRVRELKAMVDTPLRGTHSVVVLGGKGGAGKTTTSVGIGSILAQVRNDKVVAIDGNPDVGANLAERIDPTTVSSYREVLADERLERYADMRSHVGQSRGSGLDVLGANRDVSDRKLLDTKTYLATHERLLRFYSVVLTDCGTNVEHPVSKGVLQNANSLVIVAGATRDSAQASGRVMDWLREAGYHDLLARSVVVLNDLSGRADRKVISDLVSTFARRVGEERVFVLPYDPHIGAAGVVDIDRLRPATQRRFLEITATLATNFGQTEPA